MSFGRNPFLAVAVIQAVAVLGCHGVLADDVGTAARAGKPRPRAAPRPRPPATMDVNPNAREHFDRIDLQSLTAKQARTLVNRYRDSNRPIELVGLTGREHAYPSKLSGGQKQRVGIARALANNPDVLLCDEATSALDPQTTDQILDLLADINRRFGLTIVLITHEMHVVRKICDRVAVMENGRVVEEGEVLSVFTHPQQDITRQFVRQISQESDTFDEELVSNLDGAIIKLTFVGHSTHQPVVGEMTLRYGLPFNILHGKMSQTAHGVFGQLWLHVNANPEQLESILADLRQHEIHCEVIKHG